MKSRRHSPRLLDKEKREIEAATRKLEEVQRLRRIEKRKNSFRSVRQNSDKSLAIEYRTHRGQLNRDPAEGPAYDTEGYKAYYVNGKRHNPYGPARMWTSGPNSGRESYYLNGVLLSREGWERQRTPLLANIAMETYVQSTYELLALHDFIDDGRESETEPSDAVEMSRRMYEGVRRLIQLAPPPSARALKRQRLH